MAIDQAGIPDKARADRAGVAIAAQFGALVAAVVAWRTQGLAGASPVCLAGIILFVVARRRLRSVAPGDGTRYRASNEATGVVAAVIVIATVAFWLMAAMWDI